MELVDVSAHADMQKILLVSQDSISAISVFIEQANKVTQESQMTNLQQSSDSLETNCL